MKKPLIAVLFVYFFVIHFVLIGFIWHDARFLALAAANLIFLAILWFGYGFFDKQTTSHTHIHNEPKVEEKHHSVAEKKAAPVATARTSVVDPYAYFKRDKKEWKGLLYWFFGLSVILFLFAALDLAFFHVSWISLWRFGIFYFIMLILVGRDLLDKKVRLAWLSFPLNVFLFVSSLILWSVAFATLPLQFLMFKLILSLFVGFLFFLVGYILLRSITGTAFFALATTRAYLIFLGTTILLLLGQLSFYDYGKYISKDLHMLGAFIGVSSGEYIEPYLLDQNLLTGEWEILATWLNQGFIENWEVISSDVVENNGVIQSGIVQTGTAKNPFLGMEDVSVSTWEQEVSTWITTPTVTSTTVDTSKDNSLVTTMDAVIALIKDNNIPLVTTTDITFTYVTPKNKYYSYRRTAYQKKMIGKTTNPSKNILCDTYIVMKWLAEWWWVVIGADIKASYWKAAIANNALNGCQKNFYVKAKNL